MTHKNQLYIPTEDFYLQPIYSCIHCRANLAHHRDLISKSFQGSQGRAYLFSNVVNVGSLVAEERMLLTGLHYVADIYCECCSFILGWKYERAFEPNQRYKEGKFIIELANLIKDNCWDIECNKLKLRMHPIKVRQLFDTDWNMSVDSLSKSSTIPRQNEDKFLMKIQSKTTFIRELSRDFQQLFGISEKIQSNNQDSMKNNDSIILTDEVSNSTMSTSIERQGPGEVFLRMNSDSDNIDSLNESLTIAVSEQKTLHTQTSITTNHSGSTDTNSLNTSCNSSKGLLESSGSSNKFPYDQRENTSSKIFSKSPANYIMPLNDASLSTITGTSSNCKAHNKNHGRSRHKGRSRHSSNVVNPQKITHSKRQSTQSSDEMSSNSRSSQLQSPPPPPPPPPQSPFSETNN